MKIIFKKLISVFLILVLFLTSFVPFLNPLSRKVIPQANANSCSNSSNSTSSSGVQAKHLSRVGGVALDQAAKFLADMSDITGAYYDQDLDRIVFVGKTNTAAPKFNRDDLAVAIKAVIFRNTIPAVSMEKDPADPTGPNLKVLYYGGIENTRFGKVLFDADNKMKSYGQGYNEDGSVLVSSVPGYKSFFDRFVEKQPNASSPNSSSRWWITPKEITLKKDDVNSAFIFETATMQVKTEPLSPNNDPKWNQAAEEFAQQQTDQYDLFAQETPAYAETKQLGKIVSVIKWLRDNNVPSDFNFARDYEPIRVATPVYVPKRTTPPKNIVGGTTQLIGGADFYTPNTYSNDTTGESSAIKVSSEAVPTTKEDINWSFTKDGQEYQAVAVTADAFRSLGSYNTSSVDMSFPIAGDLSLTFQRAYSSFSGGQYGVGRGWSIFPATLYDNNPNHYINCSGVNLPKSLAFVSQFGGFESFTINSCTTGYVADDPAYNSVVARNTDGTYSVRITSQTEFIFDTSFKLSKIKDKNGNTVSYNYNSLGKLVSVADTKGHQITVNYGNFSGIDLISSISDWSGRTISYKYDNQGNLLEVTDPKGNVTKYTYDSNFKLISITDRNNNVVLTNSYTDEAKIATQTNAANIINTYSHNPELRKITVLDNQTPSRSQITTYDVKGRILEQNDPLLNSVKYTYGVEFPPLTITDKKGNKITNTYDINANLTSVTYPDAKKVNYTYDTKNRVTKINDYRYGTTPKTTSYVYSSVNNLSSFNEAGRTTYFTYDTSGEMLTRTDPLSKKTTWTRDTLGNMLTEVDPLLNTAKYDYDAIGRLIKKTDPDGKIILYGYDGNGNLLTIQTSVGITSNQYDKENKLLKQTLPNSAVTEFGYNPSGNLTSVLDAVSTTTSYGLDTYQNLISQTNGLNNTTTYQYDKLNRRTQEKTPLSKQSKWEYDQNGNLVKRIDANNNSTVYTYDVLNRLTKITYPDGKFINYEYDGRGNLTKMTDSIGTSTFIYDNFDRLTQSTDPFNKTLKYTYNNVDKLTKVTYPDGKSVSYAYDNSHRLTTVQDWNYKNTTYAYNKNNTLATRTLPNSVVTKYLYDNDNRLSEISHLKSTTLLAKFAYERDGVGNITKAKEEGSFIVAPTPIPTSTPTPTPTVVPSITPTPTPPTATGSADLVITNVTLTPSNPTANNNFTITTTIKNQGGTRAYGPSVRIAFFYDNPQAPTYDTLYNDFNNITVDLGPGESMDIVHPYGRFSTAGSHFFYVMIDYTKYIAEADDNNNLFGPVNVNVVAFNLLDKILAFFKEFNPLKPVYAQTVPFITEFTYDLLGRLTQTKYPNNATYSYTFDKADNRLNETLNGTAKSFAYDRDNQLVQGGELTYYFDNNGNQTMRTQTGLQENHKFKYDFENRLIQYVMPNNNTHNYRYDGLGNRLEKEFSTAISRWTYDTSGPLSKLMVTSTDKYLWGLNLISQGGDGSSFRQYHLEDGLGNTRFLTNASGSKIKSYEYDPYGNITRQSGIYDTPFQFQTEQYDDLLGYYYLRARLYDPVIGRFITKDPVSGILDVPQTQNPYAYALNNPIIYSDPSGEQYQALIPPATNFLSACGRVIANSATSAVNLAKSLASQQQMGEVGKTIAGGNSGTIFRDAQKVAQQYGGQAADWVKKVSTPFTAPDGTKFETHWVENVITGAKEIFKTKFIE